VNDAIFWNLVELKGSLKLECLIINIMNFIEIEAATSIPQRLAALSSVGSDVQEFAFPVVVLNLAGILLALAWTNWKN
jgi:hypothetical protein